MSTTDTIPTELESTTTVPLFTELQVALLDTGYHFVEAKLRAYDAKLNRKGEMERYVTVTISAGGRWFAIGHNVKGDRLTRLDQELTAASDKWILVAIQGGIVEEEKKDREGQVMIDQKTGAPMMRYTAWRVLFPSELSQIFHVKQRDEVKKAVAPQAQEEGYDF